MLLPRCPSLSTGFLGRGLGCGLQWGSPLAPEKVASLTATQLFLKRSAGHKRILHDGPYSFSPMHVAGCHPISIFVSDPEFWKWGRGRERTGSRQDLESIKVFSLG